MNLVVTRLAQIEVAVRAEYIHAVAGAASVGWMPSSLALAGDLVIVFSSRVLELAFATLEHLLNLSNLLMTSLRMHADRLMRKKCKELYKFFQTPRTQPIAKYYHIYHIPNN